MKINYPLRICLLMALCNYACSKENCDDVQTQKEDKFVETTYKGGMPFEGNELFLYLKNGKDTVAFKGSGKEVFFVTKQVNYEPCPVHYEMLHHKVTYRSLDNETISMEYYRDADGNIFFDNYDVSINDLTISSGLTPKVIIIPTMTVLGIVYSDVYPLTSGTDTIYQAEGTNPYQKNIRINYHGNIYELIPE